MLAIFKKGVVNPPQELNSPAYSYSPSINQQQLPHQIVNSFISANPNDSLSMKFRDDALLAYVPRRNSLTAPQRLFCGVNDVYCISNGNLNNLCSLNRQYGLAKGTNEAMFVIQAYLTLRDRGPYPAHKVLKDMEGSFGFVIYDSQSGRVFAARGSAAEGGVSLYWGIARDGSVVITDNLEGIKGSCGKSFAQFPAGFMYESQDEGLSSFEHPCSEVRAMPRIDSEGVMCGADFKVDVQSNRGGAGGMPRVGSEVNWALGGSSQA
ncbi:Stem-specific protein TSJT1 [Linum grandiflorum]